MLMLCLSMLEGEKEKLRFEDIYESYKKQMWYAANEILHDSFSSEDAVHEAFIGIARNFEKVAALPSAALRAYVITAAKNAALNSATRAKAPIPVDFDTLYELRDEKASHELDEVETLALAKTVISNMPETYRETMYLRFVLNFSESEIAAQLGKNINTVRQQISRGRKMFIDIMSKGESESERKRL